MRKMLSTLLTFALIITCFTVPSVIQHANAYEKHELNIGQGNILQLAGWSFNNITEAIRQIADKSFVSIQVSPIQVTANETKGLDNSSWAELYTPGDIYEIDNSGNSALGTKNEFVEMANAAHYYSIKVIVEVVTSADASADDIKSYLAECIDAGADGFKLVDPTVKSGEYWSDVIAYAESYAEQTRNTELYVYGQIDDRPGLMADISAYKDTMCLTENLYPEQITDALCTGVVENFIGENRKDIDDSRLVLISESLEDHMSGVTSDISEEMIRKTYTLLACRLSSPALFLSRPLPGGKLGDIGSDGWSKEPIKAVNEYKNDLPDFKGEELYTYGHLACVEREGRGVVVVDFANTTSFINMPVRTLKRGTYSDVINLSTFSVAENNGRLVGYISSYNISVIYQPRACYHTGHNIDGHCPRCGLTVDHEYDVNGICTCGSCAHYKHGSNGKCIVCQIDVEHSFGNSAICSCGVFDHNGKKIYFKNTEGWAEPYIYAWSQAGDIQHTGSWPGVAMAHIGGDMYFYVLPADAENVIFNDNEGKQTADLFVSEFDMYTYSTDQWSTYVPITFEYRTEPGVTVQSMINSDNVILRDANGNIKSKGIVCSGDMLIENEGKYTEKIETVIVNGDANGDGVVNSKDIIIAKLKLENGEIVSYDSAIDKNSDGVITTEDLELLADHIVK